MFHTPAHKQSNPTMQAAQILYKTPMHQVAAPVQPDLVVDNHGSIVILTPMTACGTEWLDENVAQNDETQYWGKGIVVEPRYVRDLLQGAINAGLEVA